MGLRILSNNILMQLGLISDQRDHGEDSLLDSSPISGHEVLKAMNTVSCALLIWHIIKTGLEIGVG
jgi:hypothetical protein